ncbi:hypothetical protein ACTMSW_21500 [Micromonospora sp. BQ11]
MRWAPNEDELAELADVAAESVHEPGDRPFLRPWQFGVPTSPA